jgi:hypothetical protein
MRFRFVIDNVNPVHTRFRVFVNGGLSGSLILRNEEWNDWLNTMEAGCISQGFTLETVDNGKIRRIVGGNND